MFIEVLECFRVLYKELRNPKEELIVTDSRKNGINNTH